MTVALTTHGAGLSKKHMPLTEPMMDRRASGAAPLAVNGRRFHLIGIGGCGMSGAARLLRACGAQVSGSDQCHTDVIQRLIDDGLRVHVGHRAEAVADAPDVVVYSAAIPVTNPELAAARAAGCTLLTYAQLLGRLMAGRSGVAIAGTHGKSTTTGMAVRVLRTADLDPAFLIGANVPQLGGNAAAGEGPHLVVEACEYERSFLSLAPKVACVLNIEAEHFDSYPTLESTIEAFGMFAAGVDADGVVIANGQDNNVRRALATGIPARVTWFRSDGGDAHWQADNIAKENGCYAFDLIHEGRRLARVPLRIAGRHNVDNALAAAAVAHACGCSVDAIHEALSTFEGARRRMTCLRNQDGVCVLDDYAHHPTEIRATLSAVRERYEPKRLVAVFQPHQHSRTYALLDRFACAFDAADEIVIPDIYAVRDRPEDRARVHARDLVQRVAANGGRVRYEPEMSTIAADLAASAHPGDVFVTLGAGDIWKVADALVRRLGNDR